MLKLFGGYSKTSGNIVFFTNLMKCHFYQNEVCFLGYIISTQEMLIADKKIKTAKSWPKPKSIQDIQIFIRFTNFYQCFYLYYSI